ncbi:MAG: bifunctional alpha,alpha-trehalose-phosphate synthase (UDP-forming)/trehalose-phosphatase [Sedimentisphaerales bacterium]|nr:bifunctional alpha,alpha-trehalose-phosphate synthase (UDP-forming)/trehalose-phosphatase [Sedimentisphaerales bacterium]
MGRLIVAANRLPISVAKREGRFQYRQSPGGLAVGLASMPDSLERLWMGWPGISGERLKPEEKDVVRNKLAQENCTPVFLSQRQIDQYYLGFCNKTIWPLFHYFQTRTVFEQRFWKSYKQVNHLFCEEVLKMARPGDSVWVHDFQLMLLPKLLREEIPDLTIGYFLHIPWPSFELFRLLPWREEILNGLLGADLIGFHTYDYVRHFLSSVSRIAGLEHTLGEVNVDNRVAKVDAFPMGIDYEKYAGAINDPEVKKEIDKIYQTVGKRRLVISIDRLDYTKGIVERLEAFDWFLSTNPEYKGQVTLVIVAVPSRTGIEDYKLLRERLEQLVGRVNGEHGALGYTPVWYLYRFMPFQKLTALYNVADAALITPLRDGMNLIAKEFIATKANGHGVLILGEMTGAASELGEALIVNANDKMAIVRAIKEALEMPLPEQSERNRLMQERLRRYDITRWCKDFLHSLDEVKAKQQGMGVRKLSPAARETLTKQYAGSKRRLLLLDYDGTLVGFQGRPRKAGPDPELIDILNALARDERTDVAIVSGRDKNTLGAWLGELDVCLVAEHGGWIRKAGKPWRSFQPVNEDWKHTIRPILQLYSDRTPGSLVEEKDFSLVWHYRRADPALADVRTHELRDALVNMTENMDVGVFEGSKILEIRKHGINKGRAAEHLLGLRRRDFLLAAGDDYTDEEMFAVMPEEAYSIKVGFSISRARFNVDGVQDIRSLLKTLTGC